MLAGQMRHVSAFRYSVNPMARGALDDELGKILGPRDGRRKRDQKETRRKSQELYLDHEDIPLNREKLCHDDSHAASLRTFGRRAPGTCRLPNDHAKMQIDGSRMRDDADILSKFILLNASIYFRKAKYLLFTLLFRITEFHRGPMTTRSSKTSRSNEIPPAPIANWLASRIDATLDIIRCLDDAVTLDEVGECLLDLTAPLGVESILAGVLPRTADRNEDGESKETHLHWSALLSTDAFARKELHSEALIDLEKQATHIFSRDAVTGAVAHMTFVHDPQAENAESRPRGENIVFPIVTVACMKCGLGFLGRELARDETSAEILSFIATYAFARMLRVEKLSKGKPKLTDRQSEVLKWAALGKTDWEIATILDVSEHTVDKYMRQSKEALNAVNRTAAIVLAMRYGLIP